ncbi:MAG: hypothetical protein AAF399_23430 [Bacteroidota bacterium]
MEAFLNIAMILFWSAFALATILGLIHEFQKPVVNGHPEDLSDQDGVYLLDPSSKQEREPITA